MRSHKRKRPRGRGQTQTEEIQKPKTYTPIPDPKPALGHGWWGRMHDALARLEPEQEARADQVILCLAKLWPRAFFVEESKRRPIAIGITQDLIVALAPAIRSGKISEDDVKLALKRYTGSTGYLEHCVIHENVRLGLNGETSGTVANNEATRARAMLMARRLEQEAQS